MNYGIKVSKKDYDVKTTALANLVFTSEKNLFKIAQKGTWQIALSYSTYYDYYLDPEGTLFHEWSGETTIIHNLGYVPSFEIWGQEPREISDNYFKWTYEMYTWWGAPMAKYIIADSIKLIIGYFEATRDDLYEYTDSPNRTTINGIYSIYKDPML